MITGADAELLRVQLAKRSSGAHAHTANKASSYLRMCADKPNARFTTGQFPKRYITVDEFVDAVRAALYHDKWKELGELMRGWW